MRSSYYTINRLRTKDSQPELNFRYRMLSEPKSKVYLNRKNSLRVRLVTSPSVRARSVSKGDETTKLQTLPNAKKKRKSSKRSGKTISKRIGKETSDEGEFILKLKEELKDSCRRISTPKISSVNLLRNHYLARNYLLHRPVGKKSWYYITQTPDPKLVLDSDFIPNLTSLFPRVLFPAK